MRPAGGAEERGERGEGIRKGRERERKRKRAFYPLS